MGKVREILRLGLSFKQSRRRIARSIGIGRETVSNYLNRAENAGLTWPLPDDLDDGSLERLLFPSNPPRTQRPVPDWSKIRSELASHKGVTLMLLWEEYKQCYPEGPEYSQFCELFRQWRRTLGLSMRQQHKAGDKTFVDYAGTTVPVYDFRVDEVRKAQIFVAVLGASSYVYAEATWTQQLPDWTEAHVRAFEFFDGVTNALVPDCLKSGVTKPCYYEPDINPTYLKMAQYYDTVVLPARKRKPKDKAKAEQSVQLVTRWILARLRNRTFVSLAALNKAIRELLEKLNNRPFRKLPGCRRSLYETLDRPALKPLPRERYVYGEWNKPRVNIDYHVEIDKHYYSVPYQLRGEQVDACSTSNTVEIFFKNKRVTSHVRSFLQGRHTTKSEHMPPNHRWYKGWSPSRFINWAGKIGPSTVEVVRTILESRRHPEQGYRACLGILRLGKTFGEARLDAACKRAVSGKSFSYKAVSHILKNGLDRKERARPVSKPLRLIKHENIRGPAHFTDTSYAPEENTEVKEDKEEGKCSIIPLFRSSTSSS